VSLRNDAEELAMAIELGFATVDDAVSWADGKIAALDRPPFELIEVAMSRRLPAAEVAHRLRAIPGTADIPFAARRVISRMGLALQSGAATPERIASALYGMYLAGQIPEPDAEWPMASLDDVFALAGQGIHFSGEKADRELREFLRRYSARERVK
jgi:hypothetical protein